MPRQSSRDPDDELREQLGSLEDGVLRYLLKEKWQAAVGEEDDKQQLIDRVLKANRREELPRIIREALHLELGYAQYQLGQDIRDRVAAVDGRLRGHDESLNTLGTHLHNDVTRVNQEIATLKEKAAELKQLHTMIAVIIGFFATIGTGFGVKGCYDADKVRQEAQDSKRDYDQRRGELTDVTNRFEAQLRENQKFGDVQRRKHINELIQEVHDLMIDFSTLFPERAAIDRVVGNLRDVEGLQHDLRQRKANAPEKPDDATTRPTPLDEVAQRRADDAAALDQLGRIRDALAATSRLSTKPRLSDAELIPLLDPALEAWERVPVPLTESPQNNPYNTLFRRAHEYMANAVAVLRLKKHALGAAAEVDTIDLSLDEFEARRDRRHVYFPRMYVSWAVVIGEKLKSAEVRFKMAANEQARSEVWAEIELLLKTQQLQLQRATQHTEPPRFLSNVWNNRAYYTMVEARLWHTANRQAEARRALNLAREQIAKAIGNGQFIPNAYFTRAEIECMGLHLKFGVGPGQRPVELKRKILDDLRIAQQNRHFEGRFEDLNHLLKEFPHLEALQQLEPKDWRGDLSEATQIGISQPQRDPISHPIP